MLAEKLKRHALHYLAHAGRKAERDIHAGERHGRHAMHRFERQVERSMHRNPMAMLMAAVGVGVLTGILLTMSCPAAFPELRRNH